MATLDGHSEQRPRSGSRLAGLALLLSLGAIIGALVAGYGSGEGWWSFGSALGALRYLLFIGLAGALLGLVQAAQDSDAGARYDGGEGGLMRPEYRQGGAPCLRMLSDPVFPFCLKS